VRTQQSLEAGFDMLDTFWGSFRFTGSIDIVVDFIILMVRYNYQNAM
jgi:hypothetical protein